MLTLRAGFEPARGDPIGFQVQRLNHSAITAAFSFLSIFKESFLSLYYLSCRKHNLGNNSKNEGNFGRVGSNDLPLT